MLFLFLFQFFINSAHGQESWERIPRGDLAVKLGAGVPSLDMQFEEPATGAPKLIYKPNVKSKLLTTLSYGAFSLTAGISNKQADLNSDLYGETAAEDFQFRFYGARWTPEFFYQHYRGYYLDNTKEVDPTFTTASKRYLRSDISLLHYGANLIYNFSPNTYTPAGTFSLNAVQTKSGGAWLGLLSYDSNDLRGDSPLVPTQVQNQYGDFAKVYRVKVDSVSAGFGGAYTFVYRRFFLGGLLGLSWAANQTRLEGENGTETLNRGSVKINMKAGAGYNGKQFHSGITYSVDNVNANAGNTRIAMNASELQFYLGWRFSDMNWTWLERLEDRLFGSDVIVP